MGERIAVIDKGGRGCAILKAYAKDPLVESLMAFDRKNLIRHLTPKPVIPFPDVELTNVTSILSFCQQNKVTRVDVCQDNAVASGLVDALHKEGIPTIGHTKAASIIEANKVWTRLFLEKIGLQKYQPRFQVFESAQDGINFVKNEPEQGWFIKASGLAEGKGALGAKTKEDAINRIIELKQRFPEAAKQYLVEQKLQNDDGTLGEEFSFFAICKGKKWKKLGSAQDYKTADEYDEGENTGGMGCTSPATHITPAIEEQINEVLEKTVSAMADEYDEEGNNRELTGDLYLGGMVVNIGGSSQLKIVEFNARPGDPEAQIIIPGVKTSRLVIARAVAELDDFSSLKIELDNLSRIVVAGTSRGYPDDYKTVKGKEIFGLKEVIDEGIITVDGAGVIEKNDRFYADGGRLFYLSTSGIDIIEARKAVYGAMGGISIESNSLHYRNDIGHRRVTRYWSSLGHS